MQPTTKPMASYIFELFPDLKPFDYNLHYEDFFLNKNWVLVNGINHKKAIYVFKDENTLSITENDTVTETSWCITIKNTFSIDTEDGLITVKAYFKDTDVLVLNHKNTDDFALYINEENYNEDLNNIEDVQKFLHEKYTKKATDLIYDHEFYFIEQSKEYGPFTVEELAKKVEENTISEHCFVRDVNEHDYSKKIRIRDLTKAF